jgi:hypothetical protein
MSDVPLALVCPYCTCERTCIDSRVLRRGAEALSFDLPERCQVRRRGYRHRG